jgi:hypothetical protein
MNFILPHYRDLDWRLDIQVPPISTYYYFTLSSLIFPPPPRATFCEYVIE